MINTKNISNSTCFKVEALNLNANTTKGKIFLQAALDVKNIYSLIRCYFEKELLSNISDITEIKLQNTLNKRAKDISSLKKITFDDDVRVIELAILIGILKTVERFGDLSKDYIFMPAWQLPKQKHIMKSFSNKESWDGFIIGRPINKKNDWIQIPMELKSLMKYPKETIKINPNNQLREKLKKFRKYFQQEGSINCVLIMPYTNEKKLSIDLKAATDDLRASVSSKTASFVCVLSFPYDSYGRLTMSILFTLVSRNPLFMKVNDTDNWMKKINFGRQMIFK